MKKIFIKPILFMLAVFVLFSFLSTVSASNFYIDATLVNTDTFPGYMNVQYGNYYDNVNLKLRFRLGEIPSGYSSVPVIVSPKIYGITSSGATSLVYSSPAIYYYASTSNYYEYVVPNIYYLQPTHPAYKIVTYARPIYSNTYVQQTSFVYIDTTTTIPTTVLDPPYQPSPPTPPIITDYYLSGQQYIYLDEYQEYTYNLKIVNNSSEPLSLIAIQAEEPARLDIKSINYPSTVSSNSSAYATIKLHSSSVSSDYTGSFNINVIAKYGNQLDIEKTYNVSYKIFDEYTTNTGSCRDISLERYFFTFNENQICVEDLEITNDSEDYDFIIDDISLQENNYIKTKIIDYPDEIKKDSSEKIKTEYVINNISNNITTSLNLKIKGKLTRYGSYSKSCTIEEPVKINLKNIATTTAINNDCSDIQIFAPNISLLGNQTKSFTIDDGFFIYNNSNQKFIVDNITINKTTDKATITRTHTSDIVYASSEYPLSFNVSTSNVDNTVNDTLTIKVSGRFEDNTYCSYSAISKTTSFNILSPEDRCSQVGLTSKIVSQGRNDISLYNQTNDIFYVTSFLVTNKHNLDAVIHNQTPTILENKTIDLPISFTGTGSLELKFKGQFSDGLVCDFTNTYSAVFNAKRSQYLLDPGNQCLAFLDVPTTFEINNFFEALRLSFTNNTSKGGKITISAQGLVVNPPVIHLSGYDDFSETITLSNFNNPKTIFYKLELNGCEPQLFFTNVSEKVSFDQRLEILSYPQVISPDKKEVVVSLDLKNNYSYLEDVTIKLSGFPKEWVAETKNISLSPKETKNVSLLMTIEDLSVNQEYQGYIEVYKNNNLVFQKKLTINLLKQEKKIDFSYNLKKLNDYQNVYSLTLTLTNNTDNSQSLSVDFIENESLKDSFIFEGPEVVDLSESQTKEIEYRIVSPKQLSLNDLKLSLKDNQTNEILEDVDLIYDAPSPIFAGFLTLGSTTNVFLIFVLLILIIMFFNKIKKLNKKK